MRITEGIRGVSSFAVQINAATADQERDMQLIGNHAAVAQIGTAALRDGVDAAARGRQIRGAVTQYGGSCIDVDHCAVSSAPPVVAITR